MSYKNTVVCILGITLFLTACSSAIVSESEETSSLLYAGQEEELQGDTEDQHGLVILDMAEKKIKIPQQHISCIYKNTYIDSKIIEDKNIISMLCDDINDSEIADIMVNSQELISVDSLKEFKDAVQYPLLFDTAFEDEYISIDKLVQDGENYYVQLIFFIPTENLVNADNYDLNSSYDNWSSIHCFVKSEKLYHDVMQLWGNKISIGDIQEPEEISIFFNVRNRNHVDNKENIEYFSKEDRESFFKTLGKDAFKIYDTHPYGITISMLTKDRELVDIYYAEDGCAMFELDGQTYAMDSEANSAVIARKYVERLENAFNEENH